MKILGVILALLALVGLLFFAAGYANTRATARNYSEAAIIRAQAESRLTTATAGAIVTAALLPWGVLAILGVLGLATVALSGAIVVTRPRQQPPQIIQRQILYLPPPGQRRGETWQALARGSDFIQVEMSQPAQYIEVAR